MSDMLIPWRVVDELIIKLHPVQGHGLGGVRGGVARSTWD